MQAGIYFETLVSSYQTIRRHIPEDHNLDTHRHDLKLSEGKMVKTGDQKQTGRTQIQGDTNQVRKRWLKMALQI
jgi:hypothetical protein